MKLKYVQTIVASVLLMGVGISLANTVKLINASPDSKGILELHYKIAYQKDLHSQRIKVANNT